MFSWPLADSFEECLKESSVETFEESSEESFENCFEEKEGTHCYLERQASLALKKPSNN